MKNPQRLPHRTEVGFVGNTLSGEATRGPGSGGASTRSFALLRRNSESSRVHDDQYPGNSQDKKEADKKGACEAPTFVCRLADDKTSPQKKNGGEA
jgi:hypothetical protein